MSRHECYFCNETPPRRDRWYFEMGDYRWFLCRKCHGLFKNKEEFLKIMSSWERQRLLNASMKLTKFLAEGYPDSIVAIAVRLIGSYSKRDPKLNNLLAKGS